MVTLTVRPRLLSASTLVAALVMVAAASAAPERPGVPGDLHVGTRSATALTLRWHTASGVTSDLRYRVPHRRWTLRHARRAHRLKVAGLARDTPYLLEVRACRRGCSSWSRVLHARTARRPSAPARLPGPMDATSNFIAPSSTATGGCALSAPDSPWHEDVSSLPVDARSNAYVASIGGGQHLHPDFGSSRQYGIPYLVVGPGQAGVPIHFTAYARESDRGPYPVPRQAPIEGDGAAGDHHVLILQSTNCRLYEMFGASPNSDGSWNAASGATFDLRSNALRPDGFTSADAAGLAILPGLVRYDEIQAGVIDHAIRFTVAHTQRGYIHPATHFASSDTAPSLPPMGLRLRLKAGFDITGYPRTDQIILTAMKRYGLIVADNGANWFFQGAPDRRWSDDELNALKQVPGSAFEAVHTGPILGGT